MGKEGKNHVGRIFLTNWIGGSSRRRPLLTGLVLSTTDTLIR